MTTTDYNAPVKISDLYLLAQNRRLPEIRNILSQLDTKRLQRLAKLLADEMRHIHDERHIEFYQLRGQVCQILKARQTDASVIRLLGGVA